MQTLAFTMQIDEKAWNVEKDALLYVDSDFKRWNTVR